MPGYDYKLLERPRRRVLCPLCGKPMREPVRVSTCGHRFCDTCLQEFLSEGVFKCPEDQLPLDYAKIYPDPELEAQVLSLAIRCIHSEEGCRWSGLIKHLQAHLGTCGFNVIPCPNRCSAKLSRRDLPEHVQHGCPKRRVKCEFCASDFTGEAFEGHQGTCPQESVYCENKCGARMMRRLLSQHALSECPKRTQPCTYCSKEFVFDTIQVRWSPRGPSPCQLPAPADSLSPSPEPPVPVSPVPCAVPQPVWDTQHCPGGCAHPPQGELQHCHAAVPLQGSWLQAPVPQAGHGPAPGGEHQDPPGHGVCPGEPAAAGDPGAASGHGGAVGEQRRDPHLENRRLRPQAAGGQSPQQLRVLQPPVLHPQVRLQAPGVGFPQRQRQRREQPPLRLHPRAAGRVRQPAGVALLLPRHLLPAGPERPLALQAPAHHRDLPPRPQLEELPEAGSLAQLPGREHPGFRLPQVHLPRGHQETELRAGQRHLHQSLGGDPPEDPGLSPGGGRVVTGVPPQGCPGWC